MIDTLAPKHPLKHTHLEYIACNTVVRSLGRSGAAPFIHLGVTTGHQYHFPRSVGKPP